MARWSMALVAALAWSGMAWAAPADDAREAYRTGDYARAWSAAIAPALDGDAEALHLIGAMLYDGNGTAQDRCLATLWFDKAARRGHVDARYRMGMAYAWGYGVYRMDREAYDWLTLAALAGHATAKATLPEITARMRPGAAISLNDVQTRARYVYPAEGDFFPLPAALLDDPGAIIREWFSPCHGPEPATPPPRRDRKLEGLPSLEPGMKAFAAGDYLETVDQLVAGALYARAEATDIITMLVMTGRAGWGDRCLGAVWAQHGKARHPRASAYLARAYANGWGFRRDDAKAYFWALWVHRTEPSALDIRPFEVRLSPDQRQVIARRVDALYGNQWTEESFILPADIRAANPDAMPGLAPCAGDQ